MNVFYMLVPGLEVFVVLAGIYGVLKVKSKSLKYFIGGLAIVAFIILSNLNFNYAEDKKLDSMRIQKQTEIMQKEATIPAKKLPDMVKSQDTATTNYIEQQADKIHKSVNSQ